MQSPKNKWRTSEASVDKKPRNLFQKQKIHKIRNHMYFDKHNSDRPSGLARITGATKAVQRLKKVPKLRKVRLTKAQRADRSKRTVNAVPKAEVFGPKY